MALLTASLATTQRWMLTAAGLDEEGFSGLVKQGGLALVYARTLQVWLGDDDPGLARTMAALDSALRNGAGWLRWAEIPVTFGTALSGIARGMWRGRGRARDSAETPPPPPPPPKASPSGDGPGDRPAAKRTAGKRTAGKPAAKPKAKRSSARKAGSGTSGSGPSGSGTPGSGTPGSGTPGSGTIET